MPFVSFLSLATGSRSMTSKRRGVEGAGNNSEMLIEIEYSGTPV